VIEVPDLMSMEAKFIRAQLLADERFVSYYAVPLITKGEVKGVLEIFNRSRLSPDREWLDFLETLGGQAAIAIENSMLFQNLQRSNFELAMAYDATIEGWSRALDLRDRETEGHTQRVTDMTLRLARAMGLGEDRLVSIRRGALLHDIGKMGIPDYILHKPEELTEEEQQIMRQHPQLAYDMLKQIAYLRDALDIPYCHHEKWDGTGYPRGLSGMQIPLEARLFTIVDVWDAITTDRPYRKSWPKEKALNYIREESGKYFDPQLVEIFLREVGD
jgi:putative nucleotidyltransferase with HDIG domain